MNTFVKTSFIAAIVVGVLALIYPIDEYLCDKIQQDPSYNGFAYFLKKGPVNPPSGPEHSPIDTSRKWYFFKMCPGLIILPNKTGGIAIVPGLVNPICGNPLIPKDAVYTVSKKWKFKKNKKMITVVLSNMKVTVM